MKHLSSHIQEQMLLHSLFSFVHLKVAHVLVRGSLISYISFPIERGLRMIFYFSGQISVTGLTIMLRSKQAWSPGLRSFWKYSSTAWTKSRPPLVENFKYPWISHRMSMVSPHSDETGRTKIGLFDFKNMLELSWFGHISRLMIDLNWIKSVLIY